MIDIIINIYIDNYILTDLVYFEFYSNRFSESKVYHLLDFRKEWIWLSYPIKIIIHYLRFQIPAAIIYLGLYLSQKDFTYRTVLSCVIVSEFIFFLPLLLKVLWFSHNQVTMEAIREFSPFSVFSLFDPKQLQEWLYYPFKILNLFEVAYWILLAYLLAKYLKQTYEAMLGIVLGYYVSFLFCWVVFVMFISIGNS